ncbi:unnamed protein product [Orchesella dallaii]|uniref:BTB domain-containing protein n=1 Tax=Orchesella dallaii TaxID=48710 RepID=A0ABP1Q8F7_9HEXA
MESISLRVSNWESPEIDELCYSASLKVPCKNELLNLLPSHLEKLEYSVKFHTGILATVDHSIIICLFREYHEPKIGLFIRINNQLEKIVQVTMIDVSYVTLDQNSIEDSLTKSVPPKDLQVSPETDTTFQSEPGSRDEFWLSTCGWHDKTTLVFLTFHVASRSTPKIINEDEDMFPPTEFSNGLIHVGDYFINEDCSDITILCQSTKFPAHRIVLATRVEYFKSMLASRMKETIEGIIKIDDMDPITCKEFLRFIYQGKVENLSTSVRELYTAADKYGMNDLRGLCERHLFNHLTVENALEVYDLSQMHDSPVLSRRAKEIIIWNRDKFASDPETFKNFTCKYPELVFQLFKTI